MHSEMCSRRTLNNFLGQNAPSLRSAVFIGICSALESPLLLPSLTRLHLRLLGSMGPLPISLLLRLCSSCPRLRNVHISIYCQILQDVALDQVISLDSLVELEYTYNTDTVTRLLPFLELPRLKQLQIFLPVERVEKTADLFPHNGHTLLSGATTMSYFYGRSSQVLGLSGKEVDALFTSLDHGAGETSAGWFSDEAYIPFGQIEDIEFSGVYISADFPIHLFKNVTTIRVPLSDGRIAKSVLRLLLPGAGTEIPCPSLREISYTLPLPTEPYTRSLINLTRERERAGYKLELVHVLSTQKLTPDLERDLRAHVGELRAEVLEEDI